LSARTRSPGALFDQVAVVGLGLLGGSVALATRKRGLARRVVALTRRREVAEAALASGAVDAAGPQAAQLLPGTDLLVLATPVHAMAESLRGAAEHLDEGTIVTDVGSVKASLAETLPGLLPPGIAYIGAHPMAGSHERGFEHASADLFEGAACVLTAGPAEAPAALERVRRFWEGLGARVLARSPAGHDDEVGWVSHLPHALAFAYARALESAPQGAAEVRGSGFRDFTRIARSDPELWADILCANRKALAGPLARVSDALRELVEALDHGDADTVERFLTAARDALAHRPVAVDARPGGENPGIDPRKER
jgi:prephenate dehydrogenase